MDEHHTQEALDALADLFLTGTAPVHPSRDTSSPGKSNAADPDQLGPSAIEPIGSPPTVTAAARSGSVHSSPRVGDLLGELNGPKPIPMPPPIAPTSHQPSLASKSQVVTAEFDDAHFEQSEPEIDLSWLKPKPALRLAGGDPATDVQTDPLEAQEGGHTKDESSDTLFRPTGLVEAVFLGNLPGFAGPWLTQYAHDLAQGAGPVGVLHVDQDSIDFEVVTARDPVVGVNTASQFAAELKRSLDSSSDTLPTLLHNASIASGIPIRRWLVHLLTPTAPIQAQRAHAISRWTLVCGTDEAAVIGGYRMIKELLSTADDESRSDAPLDIGVVAMGSDIMRSEEAADQINRACCDNLGTQVSLRASRQQMAPVSVQMVGTYEPSDDSKPLWPEVKSFFDQLHPLAPQDAQPLRQESSKTLASDHPDSNTKAPRRPAASTRTSPETKARGTKAAMEPSEPTWQPASTREPLITLEHDEIAALTASLPTDYQENPSKPSNEQSDQAQYADSNPHRRPPKVEESAAPSDNDRPEEHIDPPVEQSSSTSHGTAQTDSDRPVRESTENIESPDLAVFLDSQELAGSVALEARCPRQSQTQLLLDQDGRIHLMRRHSVGKDGPKNDPGLSGLRSALVDLMETKAWAIEHLELLRLSQRQMRFDDQAEPALHLFTDDARSATALVGKVGHAVKLHFLQEVRLGSRSTWVSSPLN